MKKWNCLKIFSCFFILFFVFQSGFWVHAEEKNVNRFNVVFVIDYSGSMKQADENGWRYEAVSLFLGLATNAGNRIGAVGFNNDIILEWRLNDISGNQEKKNLVDFFSTEQPEGATDIGKAILQAVRMLDEDRNPDLPSAIILLTDGNTDLGWRGTDTDKKRSMQDRQEAIRTAAKQGYPIYSVCLNADGKADMKELYEISMQTGGKYMEISKASDFKEIFNRFYELIYNTETITLVDDVIPDTGVLEKEFIIPEFGVEEVNIVINSQRDGIAYEIYMPNGQKCRTEDIEKMTISSNSFSVVKLIDPASGSWRLVMRGAPGDEVKIMMVYNANYLICLEGEDTTRRIHKNDTLSVNAFLIDRGERVSDASIYKKYIPTLIIENSRGQRTREMVCQGNGYNCDIQFEELGTYSLTVDMPIEGMSKSSGALIVVVENTAPVVAVEPGVWKITEGIQGEKEFFYNLEGIVEDAESEEINYQISNCEPKDQKIQLNGQKQLVMRREHSWKDIFRDFMQLNQKGKIEIQAYDLDGALCEFQVEYKVFLLYKLLAYIGVLIVLLAILSVILSFVFRKPVFGRVSIGGFSQEGGFDPPEEIEFGKKKIRLSEYIHDGRGIDLGRTWIVPGKKRPYIKYAKGLYTDINFGRKLKKIILEDGCEISVSADQSLLSGLRITFRDETYNY